MQFSWGTPGINVPLPTPNSAKVPIPTSFNSLEFTPQGIYDLRRMLGALPSHPGVYTRFQDRFDAADVAWFASGCATDGKHAIDPNKFHDALVRMYGGIKFSGDVKRALREKTQKLVFDTVTLWDRAFGGATMVIHIDGSTVPGTPTAPEYLKASVYLPPSTVISELPDAHVPLANVVQTFIEQVGLHTKTRWESAARSHLRWSMTSTTSNISAPFPLPAHSPIPVPINPANAVLTFHGRRFSASSSSSLSSSSSTVSTTSSLTSSRTSTLFTPADDDMYADSDGDEYQGKELSSSYIATFNEMDWANERRGYRKNEARLQAQIHKLEEEVETLRGQVNMLTHTASTRTPVSHPTGLQLPFSARSPFPVVQSPSTRSSANIFAPVPAPVLLQPSPFSAFTSTVSDPFVSMGEPQHGNNPVSTPMTPVKKPSARVAVSKSKISNTSRLGNRTTPSTRHQQVHSPSPSLAPATIQSKISFASKASDIAMNMGYSHDTVKVFEVIVKLVPPPFWAQSLADLGINAEHINDILKALMLDAASMP